MIRDAISQYLMIPMGMGLYYTYVFKYSWKPLFKKSQYQGEIGSSDLDDPFTQQEKIGSSIDEAESREPNTNQKERQDYDSSLEKAYREQQRQRDRLEYERNQQDYSDWTDRDYGTYWGNQ